jgi:hypothetical protein
LFFLWAGIFTGGYVIYKKRISIASFKLSNLGYVIFLLPYLAIYVLISDDFLFTGWDEFSFWGLSIKIIYESNSLYLAESPTVFKHYPPAQQLFQYFILKSISWSEKNVLFAQGLFVLSCLLCSASAMIKNPIVSSLLFYAFSIFLYFFGYFFSNIYADPLLAACFAACFLLATKDHQTWFDYGLLFIAISILVLIKEIGFLLSLIIFPAFLINELYKQRQPRQNIFKIIHHIIPSVFYLLVVFSTYKSWHIYLKSIGIVKSHSILYEIKYFFVDKGLARLEATVSEFIARIQAPIFFRLGDSESSISMSIISYFIVLLLIGSASIILIGVKDNYKKIAAENLFLILGFFGYLGFLLISYLIFFNEYEGVRLASFERYVSTYLYAWSLIVIIYSVSGIEKIYKNSAFIFAFIFLIFIVYFSPSDFKNDLNGIKSRPNLIGARKIVENMVNIIKKHIDIVF